MIDSCRNDDGSVDRDKLYEKWTAQRAAVRFHL